MSSAKSDVLSRQDRLIRSTRRIVGRGLQASTVALCVALATGAIASCGGEESGTPSSDGKVTLTWWDYLSEDDKALNGLIQRYEESHPNVTIERTKIGFTDFRTKMIQAAATGQLPDIALVDQGDIPVFAAQNALADLTSFVERWGRKDEYYPNVLSGVVYQDRYYGVPWRTNTTALYYNEEAFREAGISAPPRTWQELRATAKALSGDGRSGFCFAAGPNEEGTFTFLPFLWQAGGDVPTLGDPASVRALDFVNTLVNVDRSAPKSVLSWVQLDATDQFKAGNCAMMVNGSWAMGLLDGADFQWKVAAWPKDREAAAPLGGESVVVSREGHVEAAWELIEWLADPANVSGDVIQSFGMLPNQESIADDPKWVRDAKTKQFADQVKVARPRSVYGSKYAQISEAIWTMEQSVLSATRPPEQAAQEAGETVKPLVEEGT